MVTNCPEGTAPLEGEITGVAAAGLLTVIVYCEDVTESPKASAAWMVNEKAPSAVGVPVIAPVLVLRGLNPVGKEPLARL
jgi:hypothetical protein